MNRTIYLPAVGKSVSMKSYVAGIKDAIAHPDATYKHGLTTWAPATGAEIREQFRRGIHDRINEAIPYNERGLLSKEVRQ